MAVDDVSFVNVLGEEISRSSLVQQMINFYSEKVDAGETRITDFEEGSEIRNLLEAFAVDIYTLMENQNELTKIGFIRYAEGEYLDLQGENPFVNLPRKTGNEATGFVEFTIPEETTTELIIPADTIVVASETGLEYATVNEAVIGVGENSTTVEVECLTVGIDGNVAIGEIDTIDDDYIQINGLTVRNYEAFTDGEDFEEDDDYRERLLNYLQRDDFGSIAYYTNIAEEIEAVHDVLLVDDENYTKKVLVNSFEKPTSDSVLLDVLAKFSDTQNIVIGHSFTVDKPSYETIDIDITLTTDVEFTIEEITELLTAFFNGGSVASFDGMDFDGLSIGQDLRKNDIYSAVTLLDDVKSVLIKVNEESSEMTDVTIADTSVAKLGTVTLHQTVIE